MNKFYLKTDFFFCQKEQRVGNSKYIYEAFLQRERERERERERDYFLCNIIIAEFNGNN